MAESKDKKRPMAERVAGLDVKSTFRDIRDGIGGSRHDQLSITDQDIAAALGLMHALDKKGRRMVPIEAVLAVETWFGSTLRHEHRLRRIWADKSELPGDVAENRIRNRVAAALAIRTFAGAKVDNLPEWSELMFTNVSEFKRRVTAVSQWLDDQLVVGVDALREKMAEHRATVDSRKKKPQINSV